MFVYGAGSGFGKSTLAGALTQQLASLGLSVSHFPEECAPELPAFRTYVQQVQLGNGDDAASLLESCSKFITELVSSAADVIVLDSLLPCWDWLYSAGADDSVVSAFTDDLNELLSKLRPTLVLVEGDLDQALARAVGDRGVDWALDMAEYRAGERDYTSLTRYFRALRSGTDQSMPYWNYSVVHINTVTYDLESSVHRITMELAECLPPSKPA